MREFVANFQQKHGQQVPMPKIYRDEDSSDSEGLELADGTKVGKKTTGGAGGSAGANHARSQQPAAVPVQVAAEAVHVAMVPIQVVAAVPAQAVA